MKSCRLFATLAVLLIAVSAVWAVARPAVVPFEGPLNSLPLITERAIADRLDNPGDPVDFDAALLAAGNYLRQFQSDISEDNAGNGSGGSESPNDPEDGGWDWALNWNTDPHFHSTSASPTNTYGATAQGLYWAYLKSPNAGLWTALLDAANFMVAAGPNVIRSGADMKFLMLFDDLYDDEVAPTSTYSDAARAKYDGRITFYGSATALAQFIRDARNGQGYSDGLIAWDVGIFAVVAQMLDARYPGNGYDADADAVAEVLWQDSFNDSPGYFDVVDDQGYDPGYADADFWMYNLGLTGLIDAFDASGSHTSDLPWLLTTLLASQTSEGAFSYQYGANAGDEDWQSTAYSAMSLHDYDAATYVAEIAHAAYWTGATQHAGGGWVYDSGDHYTEVSGENTVALSFGEAAGEVWVDDDWTSQADVDASPFVGLVWGYDAFGSIQDGIDNVGNSIVNVLNGTYNENNLHLTASVTIDGESMAGTIIDAGGAYCFWLESAPITLRDFTIQNSSRCVHTNFDANGYSFINVNFSNFTERAIELQHGVGGGVMTNVLVDGCQFTPVGLKTCIRQSSARKVDGIEITNSTFNGGELGYYQANDGGVGYVHNLNINGCTFNDFNFAAVYMEEAQDVVVEDNLFDGNMRSFYIYKAYTVGSISNVLVQHNDFVNVANRSLALAFYGTQAVAGVTIVENKIEGGARLMYFDTDPGTPGLETIHINRNSITGVTGDEFFAPYYDVGESWVLDLSNNYWGGTDPASVTVEPGATAVPLSFFDFTPMINSGIDQDFGALGFVPDLGQLTVHTLGGQSGLTNRIQEGVDLEVGSTVNVAAGTYYESQVLISDAVNLMGAGAATTIIDAGGGTGLTNPGTIRITAADGNVTVDGFTVRNPKGAGGGNVRVGIDASSAAAVIYTITNNIFQGTNNPLDEEDYGFYAHGGLESVVFQYNSISQTGANAILIERHPGATDVSYNSWDRGVADGSNDGYFNMNYGGTDVSSLQKVSNNTVDMGNDVGPYDNDHRSFAITFAGSFTGPDVGGYSNVEITDNTISNLKAYRRGIGLWNNAATPADGDVVNAVITGNTITGVSPTATSSQGIRVLGLHTNTTVSNNEISNVALMYNGQSWNGGVPSGSQITNNRFYNGAVVTSADPGTGSFWDSNCYSDYAPGHLGYPDYDIDDVAGGYLDLNPNVNVCSDVNFVLVDAYIGCDAPCDAEVLYLTLDVTGLPNLQVVLNLPAGFTATAGIVTPGANEDPNLIQAFASVSGLQVTVDMGFEYPGNTGGAYYVAAIPITNVSATTGTYPVLGVSNLWIDGLGGNHVNELTLGSIDINVDCAVPAATFTNNSTCAFGSASQMEGDFPISVLRGGLSQAELQTVYVEVNGNAGQRVYLIPPPNAGDVSLPAFPNAAQALSLYGWLVENFCNTLTLYYEDAECNSGSITLSNIGKDETDPSLTIANNTPANYCYNNTTGSDHYGADYLDDYLDISSALGSNACMAATGTLTISHAGAADWVVALDQLLYPTNNAEAAALWAWMLTVPGLSGSNGGSFTFDVEAEDCAGNSIAGQFTICVDTDAPDNEMDVFDARPAHLGVWLKWQWQASPSEAIEMRVYRSPISGEYPGYPNDLWSNLANYDVTTVPPATWTLVATQTALAGPVASAAYLGSNNRGDFHQHVDGADTYWLDAETGWDDGNGNSATYRDIYRYVTFVKDAGGNWSTGYTKVPGTNVDRSTNYWLGDFSTADADNGLDQSRGRVDTDDLGLLSVVYFSNAPGDYRNIGPVVVENGSIGKGIPNPEVSGAVNFSDLVPFSFNFHMVTPVTDPFEFMLEPSPEMLRPFNNLDEQPVVNIARTSSEILAIGDEFTVEVSLLGNESDVVKAVEAEIVFDPSAFELISAVEGVVEVTDDATLFSKVAPVAAKDDRIGAVAAACGGVATLHGNARLASLTLKVISTDHPNATIALENIRLLDNTGRIVEPEGSALDVGATAFVPDAYALYQNYPNPFNPTTTIRYDLKDAGYVTINVFNLLGQNVASLVNTEMPAGRHTVIFDAAKQSTGLYLYTISVNGYTDLKKMMLVR